MTPTAQTHISLSRKSQSTAIEHEMAYPLVKEHELRLSKFPTLCTGLTSGDSHGIVALNMCKYDNLDESLAHLRPRRQHVLGHGSKAER